MQKKMKLAYVVLATAASVFAGLPATASAAGEERIIVAQADKPTGEGTVNSVDPAARKVNMTHGPVAALKWPGMTMDFQVAPGTDMSVFKPGENLRFTLKRAADGMYLIDSAQPTK